MLMKNTRKEPSVILAVLYNSDPDGLDAVIHEWAGGVGVSFRDRDSGILCEEVRQFVSLPPALEWARGQLGMA